MSTQEHETMTRLFAEGKAYIRKWSLGTIGGIFVTMLVFTWNAGAWKEDWKTWRVDITGRMSKVELRVDGNSDFINKLQGAQNEQLRAKNDAAGQKLTQNK